MHSPTALRSRCIKARVSSTLLTLSSTAVVHSRTFTISWRIIVTYSRKYWNWFDNALSVVLHICTAWYTSFRVGSPPCTFCIVSLLTVLFPFFFTSSSLPLSPSVQTSISCTFVCVCGLRDQLLKILLLQYLRRYICTVIFPAELCDFSSKSLSFICIRCEDGSLLSGAPVLFLPLYSFSV